MGEEFNKLADDAGRVEIGLLTIGVVVFLLGLFQLATLVGDVLHFAWGVAAGLLA